MKKFDHLKVWESFANGDAYDDIPLGTKVKTSMGIRQSGVVIPWFYWENATDGTYSEPDSDDYVAVQWDNGEKGFSAVSNLIVINDDGTEETMGRLLTDEEYDTTPDDEIIVDFNDEDKDSGSIEFSDGTIDNFTIYDDGKIGFDKWYPEQKYKSLVDYIYSKK